MVSNLPHMTTLKVREANRQLRARQEARWHGQAFVSKEEVGRSRCDLRGKPSDHVDSLLSESTLADSPAPRMHLWPI